MIARIVTFVLNLLCWNCICLLKGSVVIQKLALLAIIKATHTVALAHFSCWGIDACCCVLWACLIKPRTGASEHINGYSKSWAIGSFTSEMKEREWDGRKVMIFYSVQLILERLCCKEYVYVNQPPVTCRLNLSLHQFYCTCCHNKTFSFVYKINILSVG
jgi:hypothetical protein